MGIGQLLVIPRYSLCGTATIDLSHGALLSDFPTPPRLQLIEPGLVNRP